MAADERDWVRIVLHETCAECGLRVGDVAGPDLAGPLSVEAAAWGDLLDRLAQDEARVRHRPSPGVWSALEYAAHVRDTMTLFAVRVDRVLTDDAPDLGWWDHEAAAVDERYNEQDVEAVAAALRRNADLLVAALAADHIGDRWDRTGTRRAWERFSVADLGRFSLHEARHHRLDAERSAREPR